MGSDPCHHLMARLLGRGQSRKVVLIQLFPTLGNLEEFNAQEANRIIESHLKENMENLSAKVFRTYNASYTLQDELNKKPFHPDKDNVDVKVKYYDDCNRKVAILCNH